MKILVATAEDKENTYFEEVYSTFKTPHFEITYCAALLDIDLSGFDLLHIHWPEAITSWTDPDSEQLEALDRKLKEAPCVICTLHNDKPHMFSSSNSMMLYRIVYKNADGIIHLGQFSLDEYQKKYGEFAQKQQHSVTFHPLYKTYPKTVDRCRARNTLGIPQHMKVVLIFGLVRHQTEREFFIKAYRKLKQPNKLLLVSRQLPSRLYSKKFRGSHKVRTVCDLLEKRVLKEYFFYNFVPKSEIQLFLKAADVLFVPRANVLNSGLPYLAWSFDKVVVAPRCGNITESMIAMDNPLYEPENIDSAVLALKKGMELSEGLEPGELFNRASDRYRPEIVSNKTREFICDVLEYTKSIKKI